MNLFKQHPSPPEWDIFCQVIDNWGDIGVAWRLATQLSQRSIQVRFWVDDPQPLEWMRSPLHQPSTTQPQLLPIQVIPWVDPLPDILPDQAFIEAFGCRAPEAYLKKVAQQKMPPIWVNLEYLSAEPDVEELHGLPSMQQFGEAKGLTRWFFYPGFTEKTGGLLRESNLQQRQIHFCPQDWLQQHHIPVLDAFRITLFSYPNHALPSLLNAWERSPFPIHLLVTPGHSQQQVSSLYPQDQTLLTEHLSQNKNIPLTTEQGALSITYLPFFNQTEFDELLWSSDLNFVRGEDSLVRALWAPVPFVWQTYLQDDGVHHQKLDAFTAQIDHAPEAWLAFQKTWNHQAPLDWTSFYPKLPEIKTALLQYKELLCQQPDLTTQLIEFVTQKMNASN